MIYWQVILALKKVENKNSKIKADIQLYIKGCNAYLATKLVIYKPYSDL